MTAASARSAQRAIRYVDKILRAVAASVHAQQCGDARHVAAARRTRAVMSNMSFTRMMFYGAKDADNEASVEYEFASVATPSMPTKACAGAQ